MSVQPGPTDMLAPPVDDDLLRRITSRVVRTVQPRRIVLFGSRADGSARTQSDVDLLVVIDDERDPLRLAGQIYGSLWPRLVSLDVMVLSSTELESRLSGFDPFLREITSKGRVLYDRERADIGLGREG